MPIKLIRSSENQAVTKLYFGRQILIKSPTYVFTKIRVLGADQLGADEQADGKM